jgi:hypothetical protein
MGQAMNSPRCRYAISAVLTVALVVPMGLVPQAQAQEEASPAGQAQLRGRISAIDGSSVAGATIIAYHLSSERVYRSEVTDSSGNFSFSDLPYGYYDIAVQSSTGLFVADQVVNLPPSGKASLNMTLSPGGTDESAPRGFPGADEAPIGVAMVDKKDKGAFWKSAGGIAIIAGAGAVLLAAIALSGSDDDEQPSSPTTP